ncbi:MAG: polysaccharide pyruvyl transferase family protein [Candidatus Omnitrophota bacterium]
MPNFSNCTDTKSTISGKNLISLLCRKIDEILLSLIPPGTKCALLDFPNHSNFGDSAIWLGEIAWLRQHDIKVVYISELKTCSFDHLARSLGSGGVILLSGGGNLGDLYSNHQRLREAVITAFPKHRIVQLPQSIWFEKAENLSRTKAVFSRHPDLILLVRDKRSLEIARNDFKVPTYLCPDMAFLLGSLARPSPADSEILWLLRKDEESLSATFMGSSEGRCVDWADGAMPIFLQITRFLFKQATEHPRKLGGLRRTLSWTYNLVAHQRVGIGCRLLSQGKVVITDRLHGHILSLLLGIPHIILDNNYGKVKSFYGTWTKDCTLAHWADSSTEALKVARMIAIDQKEREFDAEG